MKIWLLAGSMFFASMAYAQQINEYPGNEPPPPGNDNWYRCDVTNRIGYGSAQYPQEPLTPFGPAYYPYVKNCAVAWQREHAEGRYPPEPRPPRWTVPVVWNAFRNSDRSEYDARNENARREAEQNKQAELIASRQRDAWKQDEKNGYRHLSVADLDLDKKSVPEKQKLIVNGFFEFDDGIDWLVQTPHRPGSPRIGLLTDAAKREVRSRLQICRTAGICGITLVGHLVGCEETFLGTGYKTDKCLSVDDMR